MSSKAFVITQLNSTAQMIQFAMCMIPEDRLLEVAAHGDHPKAQGSFQTYFGQMPAYRLLFHLVNYEEKYAIPTMNHWLGGPHPELDMLFPDMDIERKAWDRELEKGMDLEKLLDKFMALRAQQIEIVKRIPDEDWKKEQVRTEFGLVSAEYTVTKTIQHTFEHGDAILRNALYWDRALDWLDRREIPAN